MFPPRLKNFSDSLRNLNGTRFLRINFLSTVLKPGLEFKVIEKHYRTKSKFVNRKQRIYIQTQGGLGNQLFQLNFAHHIALSLGDHKIYLIDGSIGNDRDYALQEMMNSCVHINSSLLSSNFGKNFIRVLYGLRRRYQNFLPNTYQILSPKEAYWDGFDLISKVKNIRAKHIFIRGDFISNANPVSECLISHIRNSEPVSETTRTLDYEVVVHIRRGDYLVHKNYGPLSLKYFENILCKLPAGYKVLIHTDDEVFVRENLEVSQEITIKGKTHSPFELIRDSGNTKYFIGSNSTLSWWAAKYLMLVSTREPIYMIMPRRWLRNEKNPNYDLIDSEWSLVEPLWEM